jgi:hypothetical protein
MSYTTYKGELMKIFLTMILLGTMSSAFSASMETVIVDFNKAKAPETRDLDKTKWKCTSYDSQGLMKGKATSEDLRFMAMGRELVMNLGQSGFNRYEFAYLDQDELRGIGPSNSSGSKTRETLRMGSDKKLYGLLEIASGSKWNALSARVCKKI